MTHTHRSLGVFPNAGKSLEKGAGNGDGEAICDVR